MLLLFLLQWQLNRTTEHILYDARLIIRISCKSLVHLLKHCNSKVKPVFLRLTHFKCKWQVMKCTHECTALQTSATWGLTLCPPWFLHERHVFTIMSWCQAKKWPTLNPIRSLHGQALKVLDMQKATAAPSPYQTGGNWLLLRSHEIKPQCEIGLLLAGRLASSVSANNIGWSFTQVNLALCTDLIFFFFSFIFICVFASTHVPCTHVFVIWMYSVLHGALCAVFCF